MFEFSIQTKGNNDIINITSQVEENIRASGVREGICLVFCPGSTCGITTIEYEPNLIRDFKEFLEKIASPKANYYHNKTWGDNNGYAHLLSAIFKPFLAIPIRDKNLLLGTWQQIVFCDFDNRPRNRTVFVEVIKH